MRWPRRRFVVRLDPQTVATNEIASAWFTRRQNQQDWSRQTEQEFQAWLAADPEHEKAYQAIAQTWLDFDQIRRPALASDARRRARSETGSAGRSFRPAKPERRWALGKGMALAALSAVLIGGVGGWYWYDNTPQHSEFVRTAHQEQRELRLPDGSVLAVNQDSELQVRFYPRRREVELLHGEVFFDVARRGGDDFLVHAAHAEVKVIGTAFNVRVGRPDLYVKVQRGAVQVSSQIQGRTQSALLRAGEGLAVDGRNGQQQSLAIPEQSVGGWRTGSLVFHNALLSEVADELRPYLDQPLELVGAQVAKRRLSGYVSTQNPQAFLNALPQLLPLKVQRSEQGGYRISER